MSEATDKLREWAAEDRAAADALPESLPEQVAAIRWLAAVGTDDEKGAEAEDRAGALEGTRDALTVTADGLEAIADAADAADAAE